MKSGRDLVASAAGLWAALRRRWRAAPLPSGERVGTAAFFTACALLVFLTGFLCAYFKVFPFRLIENAVIASSLVLGLHDRSSAFPEFAWYDQSERAEFDNVLGNGGDQDEEITVINYFHEDKIYLLDKLGRVLHVYRSGLSERLRESFFDKFQEKAKYIDRGEFVYIQDIRILPNGDAILMLNVAGRFWPIGVGFVKIDKDSRLLWYSEEFGTHHTFDVSPDGRIFGLSGFKIREKKKGLESLRRPFVENVIVILNSDGAVIDRIGLLEAIRDSDYSFYIERGNILPMAPHGSPDDLLHANDVDYIDAARAKVFPYAAEGDLLVSMRDIHAIGVLDIKARKFKWMKRGPWIAQHDPDILPNGNLMIYDNMGGDRQFGWSRIVEYNARTDQIVWSYDGAAGAPFESVVRGSQQPLPGGNVLISETMGSRVFEITRSGKIVWQLVSPFRFGDKKQYAPAVRWPRRIPVSYFTPEFRTFLERAAKTAQPLEAVAKENVAPSRRR